MKTMTIKLMSAAAFLTLAFSASADAPAPSFVRLPESVNNMSDNGKWAVSEKGSEQDGSILPTGGAIINLETMEITDISHKSGFSGLSDITNDGSLVVGECETKPAYWTKEGGWKKITLPPGVNTGRLNAVTPDGHYAVGYFENPNVQWGSVPLFFDIEKNQIVNLPGLPSKDMTNQDRGQNCFFAISPDGRYIAGQISMSYLLDQYQGENRPALCSYVYDRTTGTYDMIGFTENPDKFWTPDLEKLWYVDMPIMSNNGKWITGSAYMVDIAQGAQFGNEYDVTYRYNIEEKKFEVFDGEGDADHAGFSVLNDGTVLAAAPAVNPYAFLALRYGNYYIDYQRMLLNVNGINFSDQTGFTNSGKPIAVSDDGLTILMLPNPDDRYLLRLGEPLNTTAANYNMLSSFTMDPGSGSQLSQIKSFKLSFERNVEVNGSYRGITLKSDDGQQSFTPLQQGGFTADRKDVTITFRPQDLRAGVKYTLNIPAGHIRIKGDDKMTSPEINIEINGRDKNIPVAPEKFYPADGSSLGAFDAQSSPVIITFDSDVKLVEGIRGQLFRSEDTEPYCDLTVAQYSRRQIVVYPISAQHLFSGTDYKVVIPAGVVTDLSGNGSNEEITLNYHGTYVREVSASDRYLFSSGSENYDDYIYFDGDGKSPSETVAGWGFNSTRSWFPIKASNDESDWAMASHSMYTSPAKSDDWMVTPQLFIPDSQCYLQFDAQSYLKSKTDVLKVYIYECENVYNSFTKDIAAKVREQGNLVFEETLSPGESEEGLDGDWKNYNVSLDKFAGKDIYVCFVNENENQSAVFVDNVQVVHDLNYLVALENRDRVVNQEESEIFGSITVSSDRKTFSKVQAVLKDNDGKEIDKIEESGLDLKKNDVYKFRFGKPLSLTIGSVTKYFVEVSLDEEKTVVGSEIRDLVFEPEKKIVLEEFSGMGCVNCPLGIVAIENIEKTYPGYLIPIVLRTYQSDPLGNGVVGYSDFLGFSAAPSGRINRGNVCMPMVSNNGDYMFSGEGLKDSNTGEPIENWIDVFRKELQQPSELGVSLTSTYDREKREASVKCDVRNALNTENAAYNVFTVLVENKLTTPQSNGFSSVEDSDLGEWGKGGKYATGMVFNYEIDHVGRAAYGATYNGTSGLLPAKMTAGETYSTDIAVPLPSTVVEPDNCDIVVMLIDSGTGKVVNSARTPLSGNSAVDGIGSDGDEIYMSVYDGSIELSCAAGQLKGAAYTLDGSVLASAMGEGTAELRIGSYKGVVIVKAISAEGKSFSKKLIIR